jgi:glucosyl-3-phosphoglycerate phosphatase
MSVRRLLLVRHGESVWNVEQRVQGHECRGLTEAGRVQAERTAAVVAARFAGASLVTSDLGRCQDTAAPIAAALGVEPRIDPVLRERHFGRWEGLTRDGLEMDDPERYRRWRAGEDVISEVGGESDVELRARAAGVFAALLGAVGVGSDAGGSADDDGVRGEPRTVVAVTHGGTIWYGVHELLRLSGYRLGAVHNASLTELVLGGRGPAGLDPALPQLARFNETTHLG